MTAYNVVRMRVKPGHEAEFLEMGTQLRDAMSAGLRKAVVIKTGERAYCLIGEWETFEAIVAARPAMIGNLDSMRHLLEDLSDGLGLTDPVSGEVIAELQ